MERELAQKVVQLNKVVDFLNGTVRKELLAELEAVWDNREKVDIEEYFKREEEVQMKLDVNYILLEGMRAVIAKTEMEVK